MLYCIGGNLQRERFAPAFTHIVETCERIERKRISVEVIFQVEDAGETGACKFSFVPRSVFILTFSDPASRALGSRIIWTDRCEQADQRPRCLRSGTLAFSFKRWIVVG